MIPEFRKGKRLEPLLRAGEAKKRKKRLISAGLLFLVLLIGSGLALPFFLRPKDKPIPSPSSISIPQEQEPVRAQYKIVEGTIRAGSSLFKALAEMGIPRTWIDLVISKLKAHVNFHKVKGGRFRLMQDEKGELAKFVFEESPTDVFEIEREGEAYRVRKQEIPLETRLTKVMGEIRSSLFEAMDVLGERVELAVSFADIFAWEIDFYRDVQEGDRFKIVVEKLYRGDAFIRYGRIHGVEYQSGARTVRGIEYQGQYYHEDGSSLRRAFLRSPLRFNRISSRFSRARQHPILGGLFPHYGVDYAAPPGTPVWAVADGLVIACGWSGGFGKQVVIRHKNGYTTYYGHLSGYGPGIRVGARVKQKQVIGYVGSTGLSTGPHLDYRLAKDGAFRNPLKEAFPSGLPIGREEREAFEKRRERVVAWLQGENAGVVEP